MPESRTPLGLTRRVAVGGMTAAAAALLLFGPRRDDDAPPGRLVLDYWDKWTGVEAVAMHRLVQAFNRSQDRLFVRYLTINAIDQKAMIAIAGRSPPDIVGLWNYNIPAYAEAGALLPLDDMASARGLTASRYIDTVWKMVTHQDRLWSMISTCGSIALYLNLDAIESAGLDPNDTPRTTHELDTLNRRIMSSRPDGTIERMGFVHTDPGWWPWIWGYQFGGSLIDPETGNATATDPRNRRAYEWVNAYPQFFGSRELLAFQSGLGLYGTAQYGFLTGRVASAVQGPWLANLVNAFAPNMRYRAVPMPVDEAVYIDDRPIGLLDGDVLAIPRGAKHPEASFEFISWIQDRRRLEQLARAHGKNSPLRETTPGFFDDHPNRSIRTHAEIAASDRAFLFPRTSTWPRYDAEFDAGFERLWLGTQAPWQILRDIQATMQQQIEHARSMRERRRSGRP